jgi:DNA-directed RNA polymerase
MPKLAQALREEFVNMYSKHDVLEEFRRAAQAQLPAGVEVDEVPPRGLLDIREVLRSPYFFA